MTRPRRSWSTLFIDNFAKFAAHVDAGVRDAAPRVGGQAQAQQAQETVTTA